MVTEIDKRDSVTIISQYQTPSPNPPLLRLPSLSPSLDYPNLAPFTPSTRGPYKRELAKDAETIAARKRKAAEKEGGVEEEVMTAAVPPEETSAVTAAEGSDSTSNPKPTSPCSVVPIADDYDGWSCFRDDDVMQQQSAIKAEEAAKIPYVGDKEPLSSLAAEFQSGSRILQEKIKLIGEQYVALRRTRGDGNCFFRSFMFSYLEHILETQDKAEVERITVNIDQCKKTLQGLGYADFTFEDFFSEWQGNKRERRKFL